MSPQHAAPSIAFKRRMSEGSVKLEIFPSKMLKKF